MRDRHGGRSWPRVGIVAAVTVAAAAIAGAAVAGGYAVAVARAVVTPPRKREQDIRILGIDDDTVTLSSIADTRTPGRYSLWFDDDTGHARVGEIVGETPTTVVRRILGVDFGDLATATAGRYSGWFYLSPHDLGVPFESVIVDTRIGPAPAWLVEAPGPAGRWVIQVHGRAVRRSEGLRAVRTFRNAGYSTLLISYRNDGDAPASPDNRYGLGDTEWLDVDSAIAFAIDHGATHIVLMGWSMGGATVLQAATRSEWRDRVIGLVLESPVVDWASTLEFQSEQLHIVPLVKRAAIELISNSWAKRLTGQSAPIDLDRLDFVRRADDLEVPILLFHSDDDGYVPPTASIALAAARPDIVTLERFTIARHTKLWNYDSERWEAAIGEWLAALGAGADQAGKSQRA